MSPARSSPSRQRISGAPGTPRPLGVPEGGSASDGASIQQCSLQSAVLRRCLTPAPLVSIIDRKPFAFTRTGHSMSTTLSVSEAQAQLPELVARAAQDAEPCYIDEHGRPVAVLVSVRSWRDLAHRQGADASPVAEEEERRPHAYGKRMAPLG